MSKLSLLAGSSSLSVQALFDYDHVHHNSEREVVAAIKLTAPAVDTESQRPPLNIVAAIDTSGSMSGDKMRYAKSTLQRMVDLLGPNDQLCIIQFNSNVSTPLEPTYMSGGAKNKARAAINRLRARGSTNFLGALSESIATIKATTSKPGAVSRVIMFTDGRADGGDAATEHALAMMDGSLTDAFSVTCFGYGNSVNAELLQEMSQRGKGSYYYIEDSDQCGAIFGTELGGLLSTYAQNIKVTIELADGVQFVEWMDTNYESEDLAITVPDILGDESKYVLCKVKLPKKGRAVCARPSRVFSASVQYTEQASSTKVKTGCAAQINYVRKPEDESSEPNEEVQEQLLIVGTAKAMEEARELADRGQFDQAGDVLRRYRSLIDSVAGRQRYAAQLDHAIYSAQESVSSRGAYTASRNSMTSSVASLRSRRGTGDANLDALFMNEAQVQTRAAFDTTSYAPPADTSSTPAANGDTNVPLSDAQRAVGIVSMQQGSNDPDLNRRSVRRRNQRRSSPNAYRVIRNNMRWQSDDSSDNGSDS